MPRLVEGQIFEQGRVDEGEDRRVRADAKGERDDGREREAAILAEQSHGESFFALFLNRLRGNGLYFFDEPEAALSPTRQLSFLSRLHDLVKEGSQFLIATHSPILMAYPDAAIHVLDDGPLRRVEYRDTEHYRVTRTFLNDTERMLDILLDRKPETARKS